MTSDIPRGFSGKIPMRGDFVRAGLPRDFVDPWHEWQARVIAGSRSLMGETWLDAFLEAPVWRFALPPGLCGARAAIGVILPSVDKVGRYFPLTLVALPDAGTPNTAEWTQWLDEAETIGRSALEQDATPDRLMPPPCPLSISFTGDTMSLWWTEGGPRVEATRLSFQALPDEADFAAMLGHPPATEPPV